MADMTNEQTTQNPVSNSRNKLDTITALPSYLANFKLSPPSTAEAFKICNLTHDGVPVSIRVVDDVQSARTPFEPSCFGNAPGDRKGCLISTPQNSADAFIELEKWAMDQISTHTPNIREIWVSSIRPSEKHPPSLRCKINTAGPRIVKYFDCNNDRCDAPSDWRQLPINAIIAIRGGYTKKQCRLTCGHHTSAVCRRLK